MMMRTIDVSLFYVMPFLGNRPHLAAGIYDYTKDASRSYTGITPSSAKRLTELVWQATFYRTHTVKIRPFLGYSDSIGWVAVIKRNQKVTE
jgi:hypothetical protein